MPIYEFHCQRCGSDFEELVGLGDPPAACPDCGSGRTRKRVSSFAVTGEARQAGGHGGCANCRPRPGGCSGCSGCGGH